MLQITQSPQGPVLVKQEFVIAGVASSSYAGRTLKVTIDNQYSTNGPVIASDGSWKLTFLFQQTGKRVMTLSVANESQSLTINVVATLPPVSRVGFTNPPRQGQTGQLLTFSGTAQGYADGSSLLLRADQRFELSRPVVQSGRWQSQIKFTQPGNRVIEIIGSAPQDRAQTTVQITAATPPPPPPSTSITGRIVRATPGARGFDTTVVLDTALARRFKQEGYSFCIRYLSLFSTDDEVADGDLTRPEAEAILDAGLALMVVQHVRSPGWVPSATLGLQTGNHAANNAIFVGLPAGMNVWLDLEGVNSSSPATDVIDYCNSWFNQVQFVGYVPGIYVGASAQLTSDQLYYSLKFQHYWQSGSIVPDVTVRGYQMVQTALDQTLNGISIDINQTQNDRLGGSALWLTR
jgi:hypothetical protein